MDVLEYWAPSLDWIAFKQGALSETAWRRFSQLVQLSHAHGHWQQAVQNFRLTPPPQSLYPNESKHYRKKRKDERKLQLSRLENHMHRAAFLAAERIAELSYLITPEDEGTPDWNLYWALRLAVAHQPDHTRGRYRAVAFTIFDADAELVGEPSEAAMRWLRTAGFAEQAA